MPYKHSTRDSGMHLRGGRERDREREFMAGKLAKIDDDKNCIVFS